MRKRHIVAPDKLWSFGLVVGVLFLAAQPGEAKFIRNPDESALWIEDGNAPEIGPQSTQEQWAGGLTATTAPGGGLMLSGTNDKQYALARYVPVIPAYPYLVWEVSRFTPRPSYKAFGISMYGGNDFSFQMVTNVEPGLYAFNALQDDEKPGDSKLLQLILYNSDIVLPYLKMVKEPDNYIQVTSPVFAQKKRLDIGDEVTFRVKLKEPTEDVSLTFYHSYTMPQLRLNGERKLQLKPEDETQKIWSATTIIRQVQDDLLKPGEAFEPNRLLVKATILGGTLKMPLWGGNPYPFYLHPVEAGN